MQILEHKYVLYVFLISTALLSWFIADYEASLINKFDPLVLILINSVFTIAVLSIIIPIYFKWNFDAIKNQVFKLTLSEAISFIVLSATSVLTGILGINLLAQHGVSYYKTSDTMIDLLAGMLGVLIFARKGITWQQTIGVGIMGIGAYLFI